MPPSVLVKGTERVEVTTGRDERRDQLIAAGYAWVNKPQLPAPAKTKPAALDQENQPVIVTKQPEDVVTESKPSKKAKAD